MRYGHFDPEAAEYIIERPDVPVSWTNYLGTQDMCTVLSHNGGGYSYYKDSQTGRITRFRPNGVPLDRPGHYVYLRDDDDGDYWSLSWQPVAKPLAADGVEDGAAYTTAHGMGYTRFEASYHGIDASQTVFIPLDDAVELWDVRVTNTSSETRSLTLASYVEFSFHTITFDNQNLQMSLYAAGSDYDDGIIEYDFHYEPWTHHFFASSEEPDSYDSLRDNFIGPYRTESNPIAVERGEGSNESATTQNHCGSLQHKIRLEPGETRRITYLLGYGSRDDVGRPMQAKYADPDMVDAEFERLRDYWTEKRNRLRIRTPHEGMNTMINSWTLLQAETCVVWSRFASLVEVGGRAGLGYRDTAQDCMSVIHSNPLKTRQRLEELLRAQTEAGYGLHLFDPKVFDPDQEPLPDIPSPTVVPAPNLDDLIHGLEDTCSDDHLWLVPAVVEYIKETGNLGFLDDQITFAEGSSATVYEHLTRALDFTTAQVADNGVALGLRADWNDCLNLGGGQSALVSFLHAWAIGSFLEIARGDDVAKYEAERERLARVADEHLWDGEWWLRGFTGSGRKIGSSEAAEGRIFLEHQAWPTIAGITSTERGIRTLDSVRELLGSEYGTHLNWPAFTQVDDSVGFVTRVYPGIKENASVFSHPNAWPIIAETMLGRGDEAMEFYDSILPYNQNDQIEIRGAEPYAYVQFIYGRDHKWYGKAQNPWLTGTAGWMYTAATKHILGIRPAIDGLVIDPCIPKAWDGFEVLREWHGATYNIVVTNPDHVSRGVAAIALNGEPQDPTAPVPIQPGGSDNLVEVVLG